ncbi:unnamed protein product [Mucor hiemalis]
MKFSLLLAALGSAVGVVYSVELFFDCSDAETSHCVKGLIALNDKFMNTPKDNVAGFGGSCDDARDAIGPTFALDMDNYEACRRSCNFDRCE